ncbi:C2 domain-containing protein 3 isoform X3 [Pygocentrus nattereri]|uniref:C2 domain-containing protein 3 isoform X3 n=1 Tax=Pygocentrus nattereri TaxID=42514 RepID=UPI001891DBBF|nr:C2 domain-containing protein 3 isoform X3 [Pygocentrus nattereri]
MCQIDRLDKQCQFQCGQDAETLPGTSAAVVSDVSPSTSIPPLVEGQVRCFLRVTVSRVLWTISKPPPLTLVRLRWWGESTGGTLFCPRDGAHARQKDVKSTSRFPVRCGPKQFTSYLTDMGSLVLDVLTKPDHLPVARVQIAGIAGLSLSHSINGFFTLVSPTSEKLGELQVTLALEPLTETYDSSSSVPTTDMSIDAALSAPGLISDQNMQVPPLSHYGQSKSGKESVGGSSNSTPRGKDHLYFQERGNLPVRRRSPPRPDDIMLHQKPSFGGSRAGAGAAGTAGVQEKSEPDAHKASGDNRASVDLLSVLLERGSRLRNAMVVSALKSDMDPDILKDSALPLPRDNIGAAPLLPLLPSSGHLLQNILHPDLQHSSQDPDLLRPEYNADTHDAAVDLLLGSVNGSVLPVWDGDGSPPGSLSGCSSVLLDSELGDPQYDQSLLENLFYKTPKSDSCLGAREDDYERKPSSEKNNSSDAGQHGGPKDVFPGLSVDRIALLGSIRLARVIILQLTVPTDCNIPRKLSGKGRPPRPLTTKKCSYFVEYLFPLPLTTNEAGMAAPAEVTRVVSSKAVEGVVHFQQRSVFPVHFSGPTIKRWWDTSLTFKVYCRKSYQKKPVPIGIAMFPLRTLLESDRLTITTALPVQKLDSGADIQDVGPLKVSFELAADKKDFSSKSKSGKTALIPGASPRKAPAPDVSTGPQIDECGVDFPPIFESDRRRDPSPSAVPQVQNILMPRTGPQSTSPRSRVQNSPHKLSQSAEEEESDILLHTLLVVPDGKDFSCAPMQPNVYLNCKLFGSEETTRSVVSWGRVQPTFNLVQVAPVTLNSRLLERMKNNVMVIEVWLRASTSDNDKLLGLVKLPLHQFYMSFRDPKISQLLLKAQYPVLAVDSYMPVVDIFTGGTRGSLRVCLAMGLAQQITALQRMRDEELTSVSQLPRPVHLLDHRPTPDMKANDAPPPEALSEHVFLVRVERVKGLTPLQSTVWGEADCYVQYAFPAQEEDASEDVDPHVVESSVNLKSWRTATTLCVPDPVFGHCETHALLTPPAVPVQRLLLSCLASRGPSSGGGIQFEVWCRYYYPNVREQLVARGVLPVAKLCAMVTMQRRGQTEAQLFSLPLIPRTDRPADVQPQPSGLLDVSVQYKTRPVRSRGLKSGAVASRVVNLVVQVHRATGLQAAARALALQYYSEVGVNSFVTVQLSLLSERESRSTRVAGKSFCPDFEHHAEFCCQLLVQRDTGESVSLAELLQEAAAVFTVYNRDMRKVDTSRPKDSVLGSVRIRLADLLRKRTGISGWFGLSPPPNMSSQCSLTSVGGLELSIHFAHHTDRERVLSSARLMGWDADGDSEEEEAEEERDFSLETCQSMVFSISMPRAWLPVHCLLLPGHSELQRSTYCYYRYKLYDQEAFCSELKHPALGGGEEDSDSSLATVAFPGNWTIELRRSRPLRWYLREEKLEVQLWVCFGKEKRVRPHDSDRLVGSAFMDLSALATASKRKQTISGVYPLFKRSAADLGGAALRAHITATTVSAPPSGPGFTEEEDHLNNPEEEVEERDGQSCGPDSGSRRSRVSSRQHTKPAMSSEPAAPSLGTELSDDDSFTATVSVERAMHLSLKGCPLAERSGGLPSCCVSYATADASGTASTDVVRDSDCPVWDHQQECRLSKELLVDPQQSLVFKVWHKGADMERVIGFASVDLSPLLSGFQSVCGWYNITDFSGQCQGQLKVSVSPLTGVHELRAQRQALCENTTTDSSSLFSALPLYYQTTAVYSNFPSHISRFSEQRISTPPEHLDRLFSARSSVTDRHDEHMDNIRRFHHALQEAESAPLPSSAGDAHPSTSVLFSALRKNLSELDDIQKYFSRKLSTPVFSGLGEQGRGSGQEAHRDSETGSAHLLLKSNQLVGEVNKIIRGLREHQTEAASSNAWQNPSTPAQKDGNVFSAVDRLTLAESESCDTEICSPKELESRTEGISRLTTPTSEEPRHSPVPEADEVHQGNRSSDEEDGRKQENEALEEEEEEEEEQFEETLVEPRPLNEVTSVTDRTSPWTSVLSDPDLSSLESLEVVEQPLWNCPSISEKKRDGAAAPSQPFTARSPDDSEFSDDFESGEDAEAARDVQSVCDERSDEQETFADGLHEDSAQGTRQIAGHEQHDTSDSEEDSPQPSSKAFSTEASSGEGDDVKTKPSESVEIPNFFLPSHHLEASMRALRFAPVFPSASSDAENTPSDVPYHRVTRPRPNIPPSSAKREETKRIAKIFASHFTEER